MRARTHFRRWPLLSRDADASGGRAPQGCLVWIPAVYTSPAQYLLAHPHTLGAMHNLAVLRLSQGRLAEAFPDRHFLNVAAKSLQR